jgi:hypothetical protein
VSAFADLPLETQQQLVGEARVEPLAADEEVSGFGAALVVEGNAAVCATIVDTPARRATRGTLVATHGSLADGVALRVVAGEGGAHIAVWDEDVLEAGLRACPWVLDELRNEADHLQALAGTTMGPLGEIDETIRDQIVTRLALHVVPPFEALVQKGAAVVALIMVGAGTITIGEDGESEAMPGDFLFAGELMHARRAPETARAGAAGALVLMADRQIAQELFVTVPQLVELLSN